MSPAARVRAAGACAGSSRRRRSISSRPRQNVIHIVLDEFQSDVFTEILHAGSRGARPAVQRVSVFRRSRGAHSRRHRSACRPCSTGSGVPETTSGAGVRARSVQAVVDFREGQPGRLRRRCDVDCPDRFVRAMDRARGCAELAGRAIPYSQAFHQPATTTAKYRRGSSLELSLFRHVPHAAKAFSVERPDAFYRPIWMDRGESPAQIRRHEASNSAAFLEQFVGLMSVGRDRPVYKLLHVGVPHRPDRGRSRLPFHRRHGRCRGSHTRSSRAVR